MDGEQRGRRAEAVEETLPGAPIAEVVLDVAGREIDRPFDYSVPPGLLGLATSGRRVRVPFGSRLVEGWVLRRKAAPEVPLGRLKEVDGVVTACPPLSPEVISVAVWLAGAYLCTLREALGLFAPPGMAAGTEAAYRLVAAAVAGGRGSGELPPAQAAVRDLLASRRGPVTRRELRRWGGERAIRGVAALVGRGLAEVCETSEGITERRVRLYHLSLTGQEVAATGGFGNLPARGTEARRRALGILTASPDGLGRSELKAAGVSEGVLAGLVRSGLVESVERAVRRAPAEENGAALADRGLASEIRLTAGQVEALAAIRAEAGAAKARPVLVHGVTGSGKTEIYLEAVAETLAQGRGAIVLVPEISLTPQMADRFRRRFGATVALLHSRLGAGERYDEWHRLARGEAQVALGARSAVFAPVQRLGLIVVDEEHEATYKQEDTPRYHAREVALARGRAEGALVVLGSATPAVETAFRAEQGEFLLVTLADRPLGRPLPQVRVVDMRAELAAGNREIFSRELLAALGQRLTAGEQAMLFLNRRGFSRVVLCRACGLVVRCPVCHVALTYHAAEERLVCHYCHHRQPPPGTCPSCGSRYIRHFGVGTEKVEEEVKRLCPEARPVRMDVDTTRRKGAHARILAGFARGEYNVLVGTQMIGKGLDLPGVTLVGVVAGDTALGLPDFRAAERTFTMLAQVAGRAGRGSRPGEVVVQTYNPDHYSVVAAQSHDYRMFYGQELAFRRSAGYPPYAELILLTLAGPEEGEVLRAAEALAGRLRETVGEEIGVLGPSPAALARLRGLYRFQILLKGEVTAECRRVLRQTAAEAGAGQRIRISWDVDPQSML
ncbi:MAG: primosomal protein N' [Chitinophagales bacterium]